MDSSSRSGMTPPPRKPQAGLTRPTSSIAGPRGPPAARGPVPVRVRLANGPDLAPVSGPAIATITINRRVTLVNLLRNPDVEFGDAFIAGDLEVEGDLVGLLEAV